MFFKNSRGQGLIEYIILVALMAIASIGVIRILSHTVSAQLADITYAMQGKQKKSQKESVETKHYKKKDLSDFLNGAATKKNR